MPLNEDYGFRIWAAARPDATESERWRMMLFLCKCREAIDPECKRRFAQLFHELAATVITRHLECDGAKLGAYRAG